MSAVLKCPSCHRPLSCGAEVLGHRKVVYVYCPYSSCEPHELGGDGDLLHAATVEESFVKLEGVYRRWLEGRPD